MWIAASLTWSGGHDRADQAVIERLARAQRPPVEHHLQRPPDADQPRQPLCSAGPRVEVDRHLRQPDRDVGVRHQANVAGQRDLAAAARGRPVDRRDEDLVGAVHLSGRGRGPGRARRPPPAACARRARGAPARVAPRRRRAGSPRSARAAPRCPRAGRSARISADVVVGDVEVVGLAGDHHGAHRAVAVRASAPAAASSRTISAVMKLCGGLIDPDHEDPAAPLGIEHRHRQKPMPGQPSNPDVDVVAVVGLREAVGVRGAVRIEAVDELGRLLAGRQRAELAGDGPAGAVRARRRCRRRRRSPRCPWRARSSGWRRCRSR